MIGLTNTEPLLYKDKHTLCCPCLMNSHFFPNIDLKGVCAAVPGLVMTVLSPTLTASTSTAATANVPALDSAVVTVGGVSSAARLHASVKDAAQSLVTTEALVWTDSVSA